MEAPGSQFSESSPAAHDWQPFIDRMLGALPQRNGGAQMASPAHGGSVPKRVRISESEVERLCLEAQEILASETNLLSVPVPVNICGDIHGQLQDLVRFFDKGGWPPHSRYLFLGDYVDRGQFSLETICLLLALKIMYPEK